MTIPLITNLGFTEVSSAGDLNDKAGVTKSKLPVQLFKLTQNISGNLTMNNNAAHKKIFLDTNGKTILNGSDSPITNNSSTAVELKGSGNVQSTLKTFTSAVSSTSNTGTTTISEADDSTVVVDSNFTFNTSLTSFGGQQTSSNGVDNMFNTTYGTYFGGRLLTNINDASFRMEFRDAFPEDGSSGGLIVGPGGGGQANHTSTTGRNCPPVTPSSNTVSNGFRTMVWTGGVFDPRAGSFAIITILLDSSDRARVVLTSNGDTRFFFPNGGVIPNAVETTGKRIIYTNNLRIPCVLSGSDPFNAVTVAAGASSTANISSTDGSFNITGTVSGNDGSSQPFSTKEVNNGTGSLVTTNHTGTRSVKVT